MRGANIVGSGGAGDSVQDWYHSLPFVTKILLTGTFLSGAAASFGLVSPALLIFDSHEIIYNFNIWRLFTPFLFAGTFSFGFIMHCMVLYENCKRYEESPYDTGARGTSADFLFFVLFGMALLWIIAHFTGQRVMSDPLLFMIMYVWSRRNPDTLLNLYGFKFRGLHCPWIYVAIRVLLGGSPIQPILGIVVGHIYFFIVEVYGALRTPRFCEEIVNYFARPAATGFGASAGAAASSATNANASAGGSEGVRQRWAAAQPAPTSSRSFAGVGRRLGTD